MDASVSGNYASCINCKLSCNYSVCFRRCLFTNLHVPSNIEHSIKKFKMASSPVCCWHPKHPDVDQYPQRPRGILMVVARGCGYILLYQQLGRKAATSPVSDRASTPNVPKYIRIGSVARALKISFLGPALNSIVNLPPNASYQNVVLRNTFRDMSWMFHSLRISGTLTRYPFYM